MQIEFLATFQFDSYAATLFGAIQGETKNKKIGHPHPTHRPTKNARYVTVCQIGTSQNGYGMAQNGRRDINE